MKIEKLYIFPQDENAYLTTYIRYNPAEMHNSPRRAILICPGGGYGFVSDRENEPIALAFLARGYNVFVLTYSICEKASGLLPLTEAMLAIKHIRENAEAYNVLPDAIFTLGFSAGGHLAASAGTIYKTDDVLSVLDEDFDREFCRPDGMVLCYPVITATCPTHGGSMYNFCGTENPTEEQKHLFSLDLHVDAHTPPAFIWHTKDDDCVPVQNSIQLANALEANGVEHELVLFESGPHGISLATNEVCDWLAEGEYHPCSDWVELADKWMKKIKK